MHNVLSDIVLLAQVEQFPDLANPLGSKTARLGGVGQSRDFSFSLLHDDEIQDTAGEIVNSISYPIVNSCHKIFWFINMG